MPEEERKMFAGDVIGEWTQTILQTPPSQPGAAMQSTLKAELDKLHKGYAAVQMATT